MSEHGKRTITKRGNGLTALGRNLILGLVGLMAFDVSRAMAGDNPRWAFGVASGLYETDARPRVTMGPDDLPRLREQVREGDGLLLMEALRERVEPTIEGIHAVEEVVPWLAGRSSTTEVRPSRVYHQLFDIAFIALIDGDERALEAVRIVLNAAPEVDQLTAAGRRRHAVNSSQNLPLAFDLIHPHLTPEERLRFVAWCEEALVLHPLGNEGAYLRFPGGNLQVARLNFAVPSMLAIEGEPGASDYADRWPMVIRMLEASLSTAIGPDGFSEEEPGYGTGVAGSFSKMMETLHRAGRYRIGETLPHLLNHGRAMLHFTPPWPSALLTLGDHGGHRTGGREFLYPRIAARTGDPGVLWMLAQIAPRSHPFTSVTLSNGVGVPATAWALLALDDHVAPVSPVEAGIPTAFRDRQRGIVSFRSGWSEEDTLVVFDAGQRSSATSGHEHANAGHFVLLAAGEYFSVGTGRYNMDQDCHSVVLIDGQAARSTGGRWTASRHPGRLTHYEPGDFVDFAAVDSSAQHDALMARRTLKLVKGDEVPGYVIVVDDINARDDWASYWWQLHTSPENTIVTGEDGATFTGWREGGQLDIHFLLPDPAPYPEGKEHRLVEVSQDVASHSSHRYIQNPERRVARFERPADMLFAESLYLRPRLLAKYEGYNGRIMALMLPRQAGLEPAEVTRLESVVESIALRVRWETVEDTIVVGFDHNLLEAGDVRARGRWCVVRRDLATGEVIRYAVGDGTWLEVAGRQLALAIEE